MTPAERAHLLDHWRRSPWRRDLLTPVSIGDLIELLEVAVACTAYAQQTRQPDGIWGGRLVDPIGGR